MCLRSLAVFICVVALMSAAHAQPVQPSAKKKKQASPGVLFKVGKAVVSPDEFIHTYRKNHTAKATDFTQSKIDEYLRLYVDFKLKVREARARGLDTTAVFKKEYNTYRAEVRKPYLPEHTLVDSLTRITYARMQEELRAAHILIGIKPDATPSDTLTAYTRAVDIRGKLSSGADFGTLAMQLSEDPSAKMNKGDLGYFTALQMVYPFESAAYALNVGEISQPVRTRFGYHIIQLLDRRPNRGEVEVSHIMIRVREGRTPDQAKDIAFNVHDELRAGVPWTDLCKEFSEDPATRDHDGKLKPFGVRGMAGVPEFERAAFDLQSPGEVSDPVETQYGWHIIRLERQIPLASYGSMEAQLRNRVTRDERTTISRNVLLEKFRTRLAFAENAAVKKALLEAADSSILDGLWKPRAVLENQVLFTLTGVPETVGRFAVYAARAGRQQRQSPASCMEHLYNAFTETTILDRVEDDIAARNPAFKYLLNEYYEGILLFEIMEQEVWSKASADTVGQRQYYAANSIRYSAPDRAKGVIYQASGSNDLMALRDLISAGDEKRAQEYIMTHKIKTESGYFKKGDKAILHKVEWAPGLYAVEDRGMYYLAWLKEVLGPGVMSFDEARSAVITDYQAAIEQKWLAALRKKYPVKVNEKGKQYVYRDLLAK